MASTGEGMDRDLVLRAQEGDPQAFEALTAAHHSRLFKVAYGILRDRHLAEDATQQAFIDIWRYLRKLRDPDKFNRITTKLGELRYKLEEAEMEWLELEEKAEG